MTDCRGCGHDLGNDRFCTQCGLPASSSEPAMSAMTARTAAPRSHEDADRPASFPRYGERPAGPTEPPPGARLSETAVAPLGQPPAAVPGTEPEERLTLAERVARTVASGDPTWLMSFGVLAGVLVGVFVLGLILVLI